MRLTLVLVALVFACRKSPEPPPEPPQAAAEEPPPAVDLSDLVWSSVAENGAGKLAEVKQTATARQKCTSSGAVGAEKVWSVEGCLASRGDLRFVSADAHSLIVLSREPDADEPSLGRVYRDGVLLTALTAASLGLPPRALRIESSRVRWLTGKEPRPTARGVEVEVLDGSLVAIDFDQKPPPPPTRAAPPPCAPCSYTDASGIYHVVERFEEVPPEYRKQAGAIRGSVQRADAVVTGYVPPVTSSDSSPRDRVTYSYTPPAGMQRQSDPNRNELGENFIEYTNRLRNQAIAPTPNYKAKCIDNSGASVPCSDTGMQAHDGFH